MYRHELIPVGHPYPNGEIRVQGGRPVGRWVRIWLGEIIEGGWDWNSEGEC